MARAGRRKRSVLLVFLPALGLTLALAAARAQGPEGEPDMVIEPSEAGLPEEEASEEGEEASDRHGPEEVFIGLYLHHVPELDVSSNSYLADFYLWFRWRGELDPTETFEFTNLVEGWDVMREALYVDDDDNPAPEELPDGYLYQVYHVQGRFGHPFDVRDYPFDEQEIVVLIEEADSTPEDLVYIVDRGTRQVHPQLEIPGWILREVNATVGVAEYPTNFGDTRRTPGEDSYAQFRYALRVERPVLGNIVATILPVAIVILITFIMFLIESTYFEGRLGLGITSLISAVALQLTAAADLPQTGYLVLLDHVYNVSYLTIFLALLESVIAVRLADNGYEQWSKRLDLLSLIFMPVLFFGGVALIIAFR